MSCPKISIITVSLNAAIHLEQTITSVNDQSFQDKEYIIIDGGSTDGTLDIIKKHESQIDKWISENDDGIADAMNKGLEIATGDYILFLHSDDYLLKTDILEQVSKYLNTNLDIYTFQVILEDKGRRRISVNTPLGWSTNFKMGSCHQGQLCSKKLFSKIGKFNTNFKICMDYDFILRAYRDEATSVSVDLPISVMRQIGISSKVDWPSLKVRFNEELLVHKNNCTSKWLSFLYRFYWVVYLSYKKFCNMRKLQ